MIGVIQSDNILPNQRKVRQANCTVDNIDKKSFQ